jgi:hypothetical protein
VQLRDVVDTDVPRSTLAVPHCRCSEGTVTASRVILINSNPYRGYGFPEEIISQCGWPYFNFAVSLQEVELMMAYRGVQLSYGTQMSRRDDLQRLALLQNYDLSSHVLRSGSTRVALKLYPLTRATWASSSLI